jgi:hypothetical protein
LLAADLPLDRRRGGLALGQVACGAAIPAAQRASDV